MVLLLAGGCLLVLGAVAMASGELPPADALALGGRVAPVLGFVVAITVVAVLAADAGLFDRLATVAARAARGRGAVLWLLVALLATASTVFLSLDTTAVLLTPVVVTLARRVGLSPVPFAMTTVWLANTASLLLPVSNLTNLLAVSGPALADGYAGRSWLPALVAVLVPLAVLAVVHRAALVHRFEVPVMRRPEDPVLFRVSAVAVGLLVPALAVGEQVLGVPVWVPAAAAALLLVAAAALRRPASLSVRMLPVPLVVFVCGLFLAVAALGRLGVTDALAAAAGTGADAPALLRLAAVGTATANLADNLPAYLALEPAAGSAPRLLALLVAVNAGPLITPWASLATLLWHGRLASMGVHVSWFRFAALGLVAAPLTVVLATLAVSVV